ncbi:FAD-dependent monooxygenase [Pararoseomonas indoligenes]|uniref:FAD-dependent monooxygenase n=1 Tax=Roseomonas indoligenes TaxID=2820811 RepID=A0A940S8M8_9PROT|nr:FAD-dependent monooxygenase [Pararoseomonas indoligenes]MBP0496075.1 FAD-dependent monooxygenase [Pararoseomonas indoligenes]
MPRPARVVVIGAGIGGLAAACALRRAGAEVSVHEQAPAIREVGAGIQITPNGVKALRGLGLEEGILRLGFRPKAIWGLDGISGREMFRTPLEDSPRLYGAPYLQVHRADLQALLMQGAAGGAISLGQRCAGIRTEGAVAVARFDDGTEVEADLVVGADGIHSAVRRATFGNEPARYTGTMCWRGIVPFERPDYDLVAPCTTVWNGPHGHVVTYWIRGGTGVNIVAVHETAAWQDESWSARSTREEMMAAYPGWNPRMLALLDKAEDIFKWGLFDREPMPRWSKGRVTLLGDAAHAMLPFLSQGAAMALEDGYVLGREIGRAGTEGVEAALAAYEAARVPRTSQVLLRARAQGRKNHLTSPSARLWRDAVYFIKGVLNPQKTGLGGDWLYEHDVTAHS